MPLKFITFWVEAFKMDTWVLHSLCGESLRHIFFPSCASVALARSSHIVVLNERITHVHTLYPSLGVQKWGTDHNGPKSCQFKITHKQNTNKATNTTNTNKQKPKQTKKHKSRQRKNWQDSSKRPQQLVCRWIRDLAHERKRNTRP